MCDNCMYSEADGEAKDDLIHRQIFFGWNYQENKKILHALLH